MNYAETHAWSKSGNFSGSGIGIGTGGIGVGVGGGTYSEHGQIASKRAATFDEPQQHSLPIVPVVAGLLLLALAYYVAPNVFETFAANGGGAAPASEALLNVLWPVVKVATGLGSTVLIGMAIYKLFKMSDEEARLNATVYPQELARYQQLQYCGNCHTLFDADGRAADANEPGFAQMMALADLDETAAIAS